MRDGGIARIVVLVVLVSPLIAHAASPDWCGGIDPRAASAAALVARASRHLADPPHPLARLHTEGTLPHQGIYDASIKAAHDFPAMRDAAFAWRLTGDRRYADQVDRALAAWVATYQPSFNPIDETGFDALIEAFTLARDALSPATRAAAETFLRTLAEGYIERGSQKADLMAGPRATTWVNNWQSHRVKIATLAAAALADPALVRQAERLFLQQIAANIATSGEVMDFAHRDALHYVVYDLEPLTMAAIAARPFGHDWLTAQGSTGGSIDAALGWLEPFASGARQHTEFANTHVNFDRERAAAGVHGFTGQWQPVEAATLYWMASRIDPRWLPLARRLTSAPPDWLELCQPG